MWIILTKDLPVGGTPPPRLSIHWAEYAPLDSQALNQIAEEKEEYWHHNRETLSDEDAVKRLRDPKSRFLTDDLMFGDEPNHVMKIAIEFQGATYYALGHEYNILTLDVFQDYERESHILLPNSTASERLVDISLETGLKPLYETALLEGAPENLAQRMVIGDFNPMDVAEGFPAPIGWYCLHPAYAKVFGVDVTAWILHDPDEIIVRGPNFVLKEKSDGS